MNLYFLDADSKQYLVKEDVTEDNYSEWMRADLEKRRPGFQIYYTRCWWDDFFRFWIDYGSHTEFYIMQDAKKALNVAEDDSPCGPDYCDF